MTSSIQSQGVDLDILFAPHVSANAANPVGYKVLGTDIQSRYDPLSNPAQQNLGSRIPAVVPVTSAPGWSANTNLSTIFCGNSGQYSLTTPAGGFISTTGWTTPKTWTHTVTATFTSAAALANYFFYGGRLQVSGSQTTGTAADNALSSMFTGVGSIIIYDVGHFQSGASGGLLVNPGIGGTNVTGSNTTMYIGTEGNPYNASTYTISLVLAAPNQLRITIVLSTVTAGVTPDTYVGTYTSVVQQRNHPTQAAPTLSSTLT